VGRRRLLVYVSSRPFCQPGESLADTGAARRGAAHGVPSGLPDQRTQSEVALFFLAFLPQFVDPGAPSKALAFLFLGCVFIFNGTLWNLFVAWSAARVAGRFSTSGRLALWLNRTVGALFVYLGVSL